MTLSPIKKTIEITIVNITMKMEMYNLNFYINLLKFQRSFLG